jgi:hypothetical protein
MAMPGTRSGENHSSASQTCGLNRIPRAFNSLEKRPLDFDGKVADAQVKQLLVTETMPGESITHGAGHFSGLASTGQKRDLKTVLSLFFCGFRV